jgi:predicted permease
VRAALGAGRGRLVRQLLVEALLLAALGGTAGVAAGLAAARLFPAFFPPTRLPVSAEMRADVPLLLSAALLTLLAGLALAVGPALAATASKLVETLKEESGTALGGGRAPRARSALVALQVALSLVLLVAAALLLKGLDTARHIDPGFSPDGVLLATLDLAPLGVNEAKGTALYADLLARAAALPGVSAATLARYVPLTLGAFPQVKVDLPGRARETGEELTAGFNAVGPGYLAAMKTPLVAGRDIGAGDRAGAARVAVVNETFADRWLGGRDALGRTFLADGKSTTVVGIAKDGKYDNLSEARRPYCWLPFFQVYRPEAVLHVRAEGDPRSIADALRRELHVLAPSLPLSDVTTLREHLGGPVFMYRVAATMLGVFGSLALLLASVGLYAVVAHGVRERRREIAVRIALGAAPGAVSRLVVAQGAALAGLGLALGLAAALATTRLLRSFLFGVSPRDPATLAAVAAFLGLVTLLASWLPAREASRVDPANAFRS